MVGASDHNGKGVSPETRIVQPMSLRPKPNSYHSAALHRISDHGRVAVTLLFQFFPRAIVPICIPVVRRIVQQSATEWNLSTFSTRTDKKNLTR